MKNSSDSSPRAARRVDIYDTTLRDGTRCEGFHLSVRDKLAAVELLDDLGVRWIEGGWPGAGPRDDAFFHAARELAPRTSTLVAFGSTCRSRYRLYEDPQLRALAEAGVSAVTLFGMASRRHAEEVLDVDAGENLALIYDSIAWLRGYVDEVFFDAEHFFDGFAEDPAYALAALESAAQAGADALVLCDTSGGALPARVQDAVIRASRRLSTPLGVRAHNDGELAVANTLAAVQTGATMVQGTVNGYGERCGNANLASVIPTLELKMGRQCLPPGRLPELARVSRAIDALAERPAFDRQPYVGGSAFACEGGVPAVGAARAPGSCEHVAPEAVGNTRRVLVSDQAGRHSLATKVDLAPDDPRLAEVLRKIKDLEHEGWTFEGADASLDLLFAEACGARPVWFEVRGASVTTRVSGGTHPTSARVQLAVGDVVDERTALGNGPVHALGTALRELLSHHYPSVAAVHLDDYRVRILDSSAGMASRVRVVVTMSDGEASWGTCGVSTNVVEASWRALVDAFEHHLLRSGLTATRHLAVA